MILLLRRVVGGGTLHTAVVSLSGLGVPEKLGKIGLGLVVLKEV